MTDKKLIMGIGCARSGTTFMTNVLKASGLAVKHERAGLDGGVGYNMLWKDDPLNYRLVFHLVRDPRMVISSLQETVQHVWKKTGCPETWWRQHNLACERWLVECAENGVHVMRFQIESYRLGMMAIWRTLGLTTNPVLDVRRQPLRETRRLRWQELEHHTVLMAMRYGYGQDLGNQEPTPERDWRKPPK